MSTVHSIYKSCRLVRESLPWLLPTLNGVRRLASLNSVPPWITVPKSSQNPSLLEMVDFDASIFRDASTERAKKDHFNRRVKPFLISRCLFVDEEMEMDDPWVKRIHLMNRKLLGHFPLYTNARTLMNRLGRLNEEHQNHLLEMLAARRVLVFNDWTRDLVPIECLFFDHGRLLAPQTGSDESFVYKAESDASYSEKSKTATTASIIWKVEKLVDYHVNWGLPCRSSAEAEMLAVFAVLVRGRELKIERIDLVTDNKVTHDVLAGVLEPDKTNFAELCGAVIQVAKEYKVFTCRWEPREVLATVDGMARSAYSTSVVMEELFQELPTSHLWGVPVFRINEDKNREIMTASLAKNVRDKSIIHPQDVFIRVECSMGSEIDEKLKALAGIVSVLQPPLVVVLVDSSENAVGVEASLRGYNSLVVGPSQSNIDEYEWSLVARNKALVILVDQSNIPRLAGQKGLLVQFDKPRKPIQYSATQNQQDLLTLRFLSKDEEALNSKPVDPALYGVFRAYDPYDYQESFAIMATNIRGHTGQEGLSGLGDLIEVNKPDVICLQGVSPRSHLELLKHDWWKDYYGSLYYPEVTHKLEYSLQLSKLKASFNLGQFSNSEMGTNEFSIAHIALTRTSKISVVTCHLEDNGESITNNQSKEVFSRLSGCDNAILCGQGLSDVLLPGGWVDASHGLPSHGTRPRVLCRLLRLNVDSVRAVGEKSEGILMTISLPKK